ncbi:MAG: hypothetical protein V7707_16720 [Motiliproteus sp.]
MTLPILAELPEEGRDAHLSGYNIDRVHAAFEAMNSAELIYRGTQRQRTLYHLTRLVAANPHGLTAHVRRVYLATQLADSEELSGALVDLCWVLGKQGQALRKRLLDQVAGLLSNDVRQVFDHCLNVDNPQLLRQLPTDKAVLINGQFSLTV